MTNWGRAYRGRVAQCRQSLLLLTRAVEYRRIGAERTGVCVAQCCQSLLMLTRAAEHFGPGRRYGEGHLAVRDVLVDAPCSSSSQVGQWRIAATAVSC